MARNDPRNTEAQLADRGSSRAGADSWQTLASASVASLLIAAIVVSACTLIEAVVAGPKQRFAAQANVQSLGTSVRFDAQPLTLRMAPSGALHD
jgi:hypothetical protein